MRAFGPGDRILNVPAAVELVIMRRDRAVTETYAHPGISISNKTEAGERRTERIGNGNPVLRIQRIRKLSGVEADLTGGDVIDHVRVITQSSDTISW